MTYAEKLRDPRWQKKRLLILERDRWCCCICGNSERNLQVHHLYYAKKDPWDYPDEAYQTLCDLCHSERQSIIDRAIEDIRICLGPIPTSELKVALSRVAEFLGHEKGRYLPVSRERGAEFFRKMKEASGAE